MALVGVVLCGLGDALGFPLGMSAAADDPALAASRVGVVSSIGWLAFLGGPAVVGLLGRHVGTLRALLAAAALGAIGLALSAALAERS